jgi:hypothetical protein
MQWYHAMDQGAGLYDCTRTTFIKSAAVGDTLTYSWNWGAGIHDNLVYHSAQIPSEPNSYILVWDHDCNEVDFLSTGVDPSGTEYPTAIDCDAAGNVYMALYIDGANMDQITVYPPRGSWVGNTATPLSTLETGAYVCEGLCVTADGSTIYTTNRSAPGTAGWCKKFVGTPAGGYTEDLSFVCPIDGYVRACEVDEAHNLVFINNDGGVPDGRVYICDGTTGARMDSLICTDVDPYSASPYDIEFDPVNWDLYVQHRYGWYVDKYRFLDYTAVTMSSFSATAGAGMVELSWRVETETDNAGFKVFRNGDEIAFVESQGNSESPRTYTWIDRSVTAGVTYTYTIADIDLDGRENMQDFEATATPMAADVPTSYSLSQNYPNPFNADTHIEFTLANSGQTTLKIYNTTGQLVRTLVDGHLDAKMHKVRWDGRNESGQLIASGIYFYRLNSGNFVDTKKMSFLR